ncbi:sigma-54-dependent transcriptional regulator [Planctomicrobium sp. SH661]|uniref:sigma-54-dependent transcriptional regulator n=1 Tax=Planctomicrobium sp. SH661 TaxID=3448124 RepID=UPI003F5C1195
MPHVLLIDDDEAILPHQLRAIFPEPDHTVEVASTGAEGLAKMGRRTPDVVLLDLRLPDQTGLEVYEQLRALDRRVPVVFVTMSQDADAAIEAMKSGAFDYLFKPLDLNQLRQIVNEAFVVSSRMRQPVVIAEGNTEIPAEGTLVGNCPAMREVYKAIGRVSAQNVPVLITGESGTGKELVARAIYQHSDRRDAPFLVLNCAAIPEQLLESELFGHEKGAFTGADRRRIGKFEQVNGGTLFLDEIGDMPLGLQAKMLRVIQQQEFERVGGNETIRTDVRLIAATHRDLKLWSNEGKFRADLYFRLGVFTIQLPPLRDRLHDLDQLIHHFLRRMNQELGREIKKVDPQTLARLKQYPWPGNIRELQSILKQSLLHASGEVLLPSFLPSLDQEQVAVSTVPSDGQQPDFVQFLAERLTPDATHLYEEVHRYLDSYFLTKVLEFTGGNQNQAAKVLGISRQTLRMRLRELGISVSHSVEQSGTPGK